MMVSLDMDYSDYQTDLDLWMPNDTQEIQGIYAYGPGFDESFFLYFPCK